jgi:hypothetical protein
MKKILYFGTFMLLVFNVNIYGKEGKNHLALRADTLKTDSVEYELVVFDPGFETWLLNQHPMNYYSKEYYETKNLFYVNEWNYRYDHPLQYGNLYETKIDYSPNVDYGLELNYKLYYYFQFFEEQNHVSLLGNRE